MALYTKTNGPCALVTWTLTKNTIVLFIDQQACQGGLKTEGKERVGEHLTNTYNSPLGRSHTHDLGCSLGLSPYTVGFILAWSLAFLHPAYKDICQYNLCSPSLLFSLFSLSLNKEERQNHLLGRKFPDLFLTHLSDSLDSGSNDPDHTWGQSQSAIKDIKASCYFEPFE